MFSYRHAFHAGNHADVLKHAILIHALDHMSQKDAAYWVIDTHAGAGLYALDSDWATKNAEFADGVARLWNLADPPALVERYLERVRAFNTEGSKRYYPGSPWLALQAMRSQDRLRLFELHPTEVNVLVENLERKGRQALRQTTIYATDGFLGMKSLLPPPSRRGMVVIDPSYEDKQDYRHVLAALKDGMERFPTGTYIVWYPQVQRRESSELGRQLEKLPVKNWLHATLTVKKPAAAGLGLHGSGMFVINPPWTLHATLAQALPWLCEQLAQDERASFSLAHRGG